MLNQFRVSFFAKDGTRITTKAVDAHTKEQAIMRATWDAFVAGSADHEWNHNHFCLVERGEPITTMKWTPC